jgi:hypothetical protein
MAKRSERISSDALGGLFRHHPYLALFQKQNWETYLILIAQIYDMLEEQGQRVPIELVRSIAVRFFAEEKELAALDAKVSAFFVLMIGELQVIKDSHDQFGQRFIETTRSGQRLLQMTESLLAERNKFSGTGAEVLLSALNDILMSRREMTTDEAIQHHKDKIKAYREDLERIRKFGLTAAQLLPMAHSNEALFNQAEEAAIHVLQSIEDVKTSIERQRKELAENYFKGRRSAGQTLGTVADFYRELHASVQYESYVQTKELFSHLEAYQSRFSNRNIDRLLYSIESKELLPVETIKRSNLSSFMRQFGISDISIQEKVKSQLHVLQQQVLYAISTDVEGLQPSLHTVLSNFSSKPELVSDFLTDFALSIQIPDPFEPGVVEGFDFELPVEIESEDLREETFDFYQQKELLLALIRAEEGTLKDILLRLNVELDRTGELRARDHAFPGGLAEYYVFAEIDLFDSSIEKIDDGVDDLRIESKFGRYVLRQAPVFTLQRKGTKK